MIDHCKLYQPEFHSVKVGTIIWPFTQFNIVLKTHNKQKYSYNDWSINVRQVCIKKNQTLYQHSLSLY
jgi:hypothetical protein